MLENPLEKIIRAQIARGGPMPFRDFMELALYHSELGYYASGRASVGRKGDFFTNVSVGPLFGQLLATQFHEMWQRLGCLQPFTVVEQGANTGDGARDVLSWVKQTAPDFFKALLYVIVEPFAALRARQKQTLGDFIAQVIWRNSLEELKSFCGVHFSNELLDAFPVHLIRCINHEWRERFVNTELQWMDLPIQNDELSARLRILSPPQIEDYTTEINLETLKWIDQLAQKLDRGWILAVDYGYPRDVLYSPERTVGTLSCYANHQRVPTPFENIGHTDITAHVDFTSLAEQAQTSGLTLAGFTDQHHFVVSLAKHFFAQRPSTAKEARALQTLMHPQFLGAVFKVLALEKNVKPSAFLQGFEYASNAKAALGLEGS